MSLEQYTFGPYTLIMMHELHALVSTAELCPAKVKFSTRAIIIAAEADTDVRRLFVATANSDHDDAASLFAFDLETGARLWQVTDVPPGGAIEIDRARRVVRAGRPYGTGDPFVVEVDYEGRVLVRNPSSCYDIVSRGRELLREGCTTEGIQCLERALSTDIAPSVKAEVCRDLGVASLTDTDDARILHWAEFIAEVQRREATGGSQLVDLAQRCGSAGRHRLAESLFQKAFGLGLSPNAQAEVHRGLGHIAAAQGEESSAIEHFEAALALNPRCGVKKHLLTLRRRTSGAA